MKFFIFLLKIVIKKSWQLAQNALIVFSGIPCHLILVRNFRGTFLELSWNLLYFVCQKNKLAAGTNPVNSIQENTMPTKPCQLVSGLE